MCNTFNTYASTETKMSSFWWNFHHWLHWKLSFWQLSVQPVMKISSKWRHFRFSECMVPQRLTHVSHGQNGNKFADDNIKCNFANENWLVLIIKSPGVTRGLTVFGWVPPPAWWKHFSTFHANCWSHVLQTSHDWYKCMGKFIGHIGDLG